MKLHLLPSPFSRSRSSREPREPREPRSPRGPSSCWLSPARRAGFTLIELIAVMGIIVALAMVVMGGYSGIARAIAAGQATRQLRDALLLARQNACVNGNRTYVYVLGEDEFVICRKIGTSSGTEGKASYNSGDPMYKKDTYIFNDYYTDLSSFVNEVDRGSESSGNDSSSSSYKKADLSSNMLLFDLSGDEAQYGILRGVESNGKLGWSLFWKMEDGSQPPSKYFKENHEYGIALFPVRSLPKGFVFDTDGSTPIGTCVYFEPTGMAGPKRGDQKFVICEAAFPNNKDHQHTVTIAHSGKITVEEKN